MFKTKNDLSEEIRAKAVELLNARLADCIDLQTQTKQAHWNVKGPHFIALHELFDKINEAVEDYVDDIAERAVQLGAVAEGTARMVAKRSSLAEYPAGAVNGRSHVEAPDHQQRLRRRAGSISPRPLSRSEECRYPD
jgi:starvation-inducible DNA-binding protein